MSRGDNPQIDGKTYQEAIFDQAGILIISLEEVLEDEEDSLEQRTNYTVSGYARKKKAFLLA